MFYQSQFDALPGLGSIESYSVCRAVIPSHLGTESVQAALVSRNLYTGCAKHYTIIAQNEDIFGPGD